MNRRITPAQREVMRELTAQYGRPDRVLVEKFGVTGPVLVWMRWHNQSISSQFPDRNLFIKPDGSRLVWTLEEHDIDA